MENNELIKNAICYAKKNATSNTITIQDIATNAGFSTDYFNKLFLSHTGFTVMAYVNYLRLKRASELLRTTDKSILSIALEVGYDSHEGFLKAFKKQYGITPSSYRTKMQNIILNWGELTDTSIVYRFLHDNSDFKLIDSDTVIDFLLKKDARQYGYLCITIKCMGLFIVAPDGDISDGFIGIGDDRRGGYYLEIATDNLDKLAQWISRFENISAFYSKLEPEQIMSLGLKIDFSHTPQALYFGNGLPCNLPDNLTIRPLIYDDKEQIIKWANGRNDGYVKHLLNEKHYLDECVLEYGVFEDGELIAIAGCGIDEAHGFKVNNCCVIRFADGKANDTLYKQIFSYVTNDVINKGILPFDDIQHGEYALTHGRFTSEELGYEIVNYRYDIL